MAPAGTSAGAVAGGDPGGVGAAGHQVLELGGHAGVQGWDGETPPVQVGDQLAGVAARPNVVTGQRGPLW